MMARWWSSKTLFISLPVAISVGVALFAEQAMASPARRLARRGYVVAPPGAQVIVPPAPPPAAAMPPGGRLPRWPLLGRGDVAAAAAAAAAAARIPTAPGLPAGSGPLPPRTAARGEAAPLPSRPAANRDKLGIAASPPQSAPNSIAEEIPPPQPVGALPLGASGEAPAAEDVFTEAWFARHPQAWRAAQASDWWQAADTAAVAAWLGRPVVRAGAAGQNASATVAAARQDDVDAAGLRSVLILPAGHDNRGGDAEWLPLGAFVLLPRETGGTRSTRSTRSTSRPSLQLAVDHAGAMRGNFYDAVSGTAHPVTGHVDADTLVATWTVGPAGGRFTAPVASFATAPRTVVVAVGSERHDMELVPLPRPARP